MATGRLNVAGTKKNIKKEAPAKLVKLDATRREKAAQSVTPEEKREMLLSDPNMVRLLDQISNSDGYMLTCSTRKGDGVKNIQHHLLFNGFRAMDLLPCHTQVEKLIVDKLRRPDIGEVVG